MMILPVGVWPYFLYKRSIALKHFQRICHIKEVELHVDWWRRILPGFKGFRAIFQYCSLKQEEDRLAVNDRCCKIFIGKKELYALRISTGNRI